MEYLTSMSASEAAAAIRAKEITSLELVDACLRRIGEREPVVNAWAFLDPERARAAARACDAATAAGTGVGPLHGVPVGVKDVIDTADMPTEYGSAIHRGHRPLRDAACVALIRRAGGIALGKTVTTEFAMYQPNKTANPHNPAHTPGGSSSGSAAAVADRHVPVALGTQTSGSIIRPAAFCGVIGYKPSFGTFAIEGVKTLAASLDTLGLLARGIDDLLLMYDVFAGLPAATAATRPRKAGERLRIGFWQPPFAPAPAADADGLARACARLAGVGFALEPVAMPAALAELNDVHAALMAYEVARNHLYEYEPPRRALMAATTSAVMEQGWRVPFEDYLGYRETTRAARAAFDAIARTFDAILVPAAPGEAPPIAATGDPVFNRMWSLLGVPALTLPVGTGPNGLPIGVQLVSRYDGDLALLDVARQLEPAIRG
ncbi:amidase [Burkholderia sp. WAC0059]|uniref:amidase n=1 Tax=Burkholderia sp. WAC0059 TaxID=2066022 RepID=UPI000C7F59FF|nr:amidase [Burkholderia sp. WAC0059]PLZ02125.1 amidase [Burkholderia sp. WAC0059]